MSYEPKIITDPIELTDIILYGAKGKPARKYKKVILAGEAERSEGEDSRKGYLTKTPDQWISYFKEKGKQMLDLPLFYAVIERMVEIDHPGKENLLNELRTTCLVLATRFFEHQYEQIFQGGNLNYRREEKVIHQYGFAPEEMPSYYRPPGDKRFLKNIKTEEEWKPALQNILRCKDLTKVDKVLQGFTGKEEPCITATVLGDADLESNAVASIRAKWWFDMPKPDFKLVCGNPLGCEWAARWAVLEE